jgi:type IV pilus assembly protein PilN
MAHINLLPWREEKRQERQKQFYTVLVTGIIFAAAVLYGAILFVDSLISEQNNRNAYLQKEIAALDIKIKEISKLEEERAKLLARMQVIQDLQASRSKVVRVFDSIPRDLPEGAYLENVAREGNVLTFNGVAQSNARVSVLMRQLDADKEFEESKLQVIQRTSTNPDAIRKFTLSVTESNPNKEEGEK